MNLVIMFRQISLSLEILIDAAKRGFLDTRLEGDRRRREKVAGLDKKRKAMVDVRHTPHCLTTYGETLPRAIKLMSEAILQAVAA